MILFNDQSNESMDSVHLQKYLKHMLKNALKILMLPHFTVNILFASNTGPSLLDLNCPGQMSSSPNLQKL